MSAFRNGQRTHASARVRGAFARGFVFAVVAFFSLRAVSQTAGPSAGLSTLTNIQQVLVPVQANEQPPPHPVQVEGVITQVRGWLGRWITIHDGRNGCAVQAPADISQLRPGLRVQVEGELAGETHFAYIANAQFTVLGEGSLPEPVKAEAARLATGSHHAGWVKIKGSVLDIARTDEKLVYLVGSGSASFNMWVEEPIDRLPLEQLNATVEVRGVSWSVASGQPRRPTRFTLHAGGQSNITILTAGSTNPWARPPMTLKQFAEIPPGDERRVVRGTVTYVNPSGMFTMEDGTEEAQVTFMGPIPTDNKRAEFVPRGERPRLQPGDVVEIVCTKLRQRAHSPLVEWSEVRVTGRAPLSDPPLVTPAGILTGQPDCRRIRLRGRVFDHEQLMQGSVHISRLLIQIGNRTTYGVYAGPRYADFAPLLGQEVEMICVPVISQGNTAVRSFTVYVSDPGDIRVLPPLPLWKNPTILKVAAGISAALLLAGAWIILLRRRVAVRTAELATSNQRLRDSEQALQRALAHEQEINQLKSNFVSMVSHEFRTPLGVIVSSVDILRRYLDRLDPPTRSAQFDRILRSTANLANLIEDLLLLGKVEAGKLICQPAPLDLPSLCRHLTDEVLSATHQACPIRLQIESDLTGAAGDETLLRPVLTNLLSNAVKYSAPGSPVEFRVLRQGNDAQFIIRDHGIGIPEKEQARLFEAFSRGSNVGGRQGTGLGLVIARRCVELHKGRIEFQSKAEAGTTFTVSLEMFATDVERLGDGLGRKEAQNQNQNQEQA